MNPKVLEESGFPVIGIEARTSNSREMSGTGIIAGQWARFLKDNLLAQIPRKTDAAILAVYSDYVGDKDGEYSFLIGARVSSATEAPDGMMARKVPAGKYAVFTSDTGPVEKVVLATWQKIWVAPGIERAYQVDFEVYDQRARDPMNAKVDIWVGIK